MRKLLNAFTILFYAFLPFGLLSYYELLNYPKVLFSTPAQLKHFSEEDMGALRSQCGEPLELSYLKDKIYIRCGRFWPRTKIYVVDVKNTATIFQEYAKESADRAR